MNKFDTFIHKQLRRPYHLNYHIEPKAEQSRATVLFIHGIGTSTKAWHKVIQHLPNDVRVVSVDLLGFGLSPRPGWAAYDAKCQARSVMATYRKLRRNGPLVIVGHSLGALVAVEIAKIYPRRVQSLVLCSPPFYTSDDTHTKLLSSNEKILLSLYRAIQSRPDQFLKISTIAAKYGIINRAFQVSDDNIHAYMGALEASIVNQTAYADIQQLSLPIRALYGTLDPVVIAAHIKRLNRTMPNVTTKSVAVGHEIRGVYITAIVKAVNASLTPEVK